MHNDTYVWCVPYGRSSRAWHKVTLGYLVASCCNSTWSSFLSPWTINSGSDLCTHQSCWTYYHPFDSHFPRTTWVSWHLKGRPLWSLMKQMMMGGSGSSWTICKSFSVCSQHITMPACHNRRFYRLNALPDTQPTVPKHWRHMKNKYMISWKSLKLEKLRKTLTIMSKMQQKCCHNI